MSKRPLTTVQIGTRLAVALMTICLLFAVGSVLWALALRVGDWLLGMVGL